MDDLYQPSSPMALGVGFGAIGVSGQGDPDFLYRSGYIDEQQAIGACQEEWLASTRRHYKRKECQAMASRLLSVGEHPGQDFFRLLQHKLQEYNVAMPTVQIEYKNLTVTTQAIIGSAGIPTAGNFAPQLVKAALGLNKGSMQKLIVLDGLNGVLKPGRCTLLLGPPGAGKTTFLRVLGNRLRGCKNLKVSGDLLYNGHKKEEFVVERTTAFVDQHDNHISNLTVAETVKFAHTCHRGYREPEFNLSGELCKAKARSIARSNHSQQQQQQSPSSPQAATSKPQQGLIMADIEHLITQVWGSGAKTEVVMHLLGLGHCKDTLVGDGGLMLRGISSGERKRLTTAEMVVGPQRVLLMDEISTGLDSATLHSVITFFTAMSHALNMTTIISLLQPPPDVFNLFDDLLLLAGGKVIYHGPLQDALPHFTAMGFECPARKDFPSFLLETVTPVGQLEFASKALIAALQASANIAKIEVDTAAGMLLSLDQLAGSFWSNSHAGTAMVAQLSEPFDPALSHPAALEKRQYALDHLQAIGVATRRQMKLVLRDKVLLRGRILQILVVSFMVGSLFFQLGHGINDARSFYGAAFMVILFMAMGTMPQIGVVMAQKGVWLKHRDSFLYPGYAHGMAMALSQLPVSVLEATLFSCIVYFMVGFHLNVGHFFIFWAVVVASNLCLSALFRLLAVLAPNPTLAAAYGGLGLLILILTSGFAIVRGSIPPYWIWSYYLSPFAYGLRAIVINEFRSSEWKQRVIGVPGATTMGQAALVSFDFYTEEKWISIGIGFLFGAYIVFSAFTCLALGWVTGPQHVARLPDAKQLAAASQAAQQRRNDAQGKLTGQQTAKGKHNSVSKIVLADCSKGISKATRRTSHHTTVSGTAKHPPDTVNCSADCGSSSSNGGGGSSTGFGNPRSGGGSVYGTPRGHAADSNSHHTGIAASAISLGRVSWGDTSWGATSSLLGAGLSGGVQMVRAVFRSSDYGDIFSPKAAVKISMTDGALEFVPITLVFQDIRYYVPNPSYKRSSWFSKAPFQLDSSFIKQDSWPGIELTESALAGKQHKQHNVAKTSKQHPARLDWLGSSADESALPVHAVHSRSSNINSNYSKGIGNAAAECAQPKPPKELELLKGVSGHAVPGKLVALMGGSGAGKTTLMDVICGRKTVGRTCGLLLVNGRPMVKASWSRVVGYVEQMDVHTPAQTVIEALWFSARLRLGTQVSDHQARAYVEQVIDMVDLTEHAFSLVGMPGRSGGLSSDQLKRVTIAVELVANPSMVFMDEPTSGLDARAAAIVMRAVHNVAHGGRTVMVTIHQPSIEIFEAFNTVLLLQRGGRTAYFGPLGHESSQLIAYLQAIPGTAPIAPGQNPASWMLEVTGGSMAVIAQPNQVDWPAMYAASSLAASNAAAGDRLKAEGQAARVQLRIMSVCAQPFNIQVWELLLKYRQVYWRTPSYTLARCFLTLCVAFIYGSMYYRQGKLPTPYASIGSIQNVMGIMFSSTNFLGMTNLMSVMPLVGLERVVFYRERGASMYDPFAYGIAIAVLELPYLLVQAALFVPIIYFMIDFAASLEKFFYYLLMFLASISFYTILGQLMVYITPNQQMAQVLGAGLNFTFNIFNGFVIAYPAMPYYWRWLNRTVPTTWVLYGLGVSQLGDVSDHLVQFAARRVPANAFAKTLFDFDYGMRWWCLLIVFGYAVSFRVMSILALKYINFLRR